MNQTFHEKIISLQKSVYVPKGNYNDFGKYQYRTCEDILSALRKILPGLGLFINICDVIEMVGDRHYIKSIVSISDGEKTITSTGYAREPLSKKGMDESQITGTASSYARKFALAGIIGLDDEEDPDGKDNQKEGTGPSKDEAIALLKKRLIEMKKSEEDLLKYLTTYFKAPVTFETITMPQYEHAMSFLTPKKKA